MGMSFIVFGATAQLGTLPLIAIGAPWWLILATALVVNLRFVIFSAALAGPLAGGTPAAALAVRLSAHRRGVRHLPRAPAPARPTRMAARLLPGAVVVVRAAVAELALTGVLAAGPSRGWSLEFMASIALLVLLVPMARVRPMLVAMLTGGVLSVLLRGLPCAWG